jgi:sarcosine dehydrogenase
LILFNKIKFLFNTKARNETFSDALYELLKSNGCVYRERHGIQCPDWFDLVSTPLTTEQYIDLDNTYDWSEDSRQWKAIKYECQSCHERAAVFNLSSMAKYLVRGENAQQVIDSLSPTDVKSMLNNSTILSYLLNTRGGITAEIIINKVNDNEFYITCADISTNHVFINFCNLINDQNIKNTEIIDLSKDVGILSINGPKSTQILEKCLNISLENIDDKTHREIEVDVRI